jgi:hypothetical protein
MEKWFAASSRASPRCTSITPELVCTVTRAPNGDVFEFAAYATTVPTTSLSRFTSYSPARVAGAAGGCCPNAPVDNAIAAAATIQNFLLLMSASSPENLFPTQQTLPHFSRFTNPTLPQKSRSKKIFRFFPAKTSH